MADSEELIEYRPEALSHALADAARRARFSKRTRRRMTVESGLAQRRGEQLFKLFYVASFVLIVCIPFALGSAYYGFLASDQYVSEARFTVNGGDTAPLDNLGTMLGIGGISSAQDLQVIVNFLESREIVEQLQKDVDLRGRYGRPATDIFSRFDSSEPVEKLVKYWKRMTDVSLTMPSGIVTFSVRAFSPEDAVLIANAALKRSESLVNEMNERMRRDALAAAEQDFDKAASKLQNVRLALETERNLEGILDAGQAAASIDKLIGELTSERMKSEQEYSVLSRSVSADSPSIRNLKSRIAAADEQIAALRSKLTSGTFPQRGVLAASMTRFSQLALDYQIAQKQYSSAAATLELARANIERKRVYITRFVKPTIPGSPLYPKRVLYPSFVLAAALLLWTVICSCVTLIRNYMA